MNVKSTVSIKQHVYKWKIETEDFEAEISTIRISNVEVPRTLYQRLFGAKSAELRAIIQFVSKIPLVESAANDIFRVYLAQGKKTCMQLLLDYQRLAPNGKMRFYVGFSPFSPGVDEFTLTNGAIGCAIKVAGYNLGVTDDEKRIKAELLTFIFPRNVYCYHGNRPIEMTLEQFKKLHSSQQEQVEKIARPLVRLNLIVDYLTAKRIEKIVADIFNNREESLASAETDAKRRLKRDKTFNRLYHKSIRVSGGRLVSGEKDAVYYVTRNKVFRLGYASTQLKEAVFRAVSKRAVPPKLIEVERAKIPKWIELQVENYD
jgi:hypothetical protein